jgi:adenylyltransferase/sulfurtransferase
VSRYSRHLLLSEVGEEGQRRLLAARVAIIGAGGLGCPAALYLSAAGVGTIGLVDPDRVDASNLQRQVLYAEADVGRPKTDVARERLMALDPSLSVETYPVALSAANALELLRDYDLVIDGTDNFPTRYLVNDACVLLGVPNVHGSVLRFEGRVSVFGTKDGPCYRCLFPTPPPPDSVPDCAEAGVLGVMPGLIGMLQATEAIKWIVGAGDVLAGRLLLVDALRMRFQTVAIRRDPRCPACGTRELTGLIDYDAFCGVPRAPRDDIERLTPSEVAERMRRPDAPQLIDVREPWEWSLARLPGAVLMPLGALPELLPTLDASRETILYCHRGSRSLAAALHLSSAGFRRVGHLEGGIDRWSSEVDPALPRY